MARHAADGPGAGDVPVPRAPRAALRGDRRDRDPRARQDPGRGARKPPAGDRVRGGGVRLALPDDGLRPRERRARDRLPGPAAASRRLRRDRALQLPGDGASVVSALRRRHRKHVHRQAVRAGPPDAAEDRAASRGVPAAGRRQPGQRRTRRRRGDLRPSRHPRRLVRRLDGGRAGGVPAGDARRQARAGSGRREEFRRGHAGRGFRPGDRRHHGILLRLRRRAMPGRKRDAAGRIGARGGAGSAHRVGAGPPGRRRVEARRGDGPGDQRGASGPRARLHRKRDRRRRPAAAGRPPEPGRGSSGRLLPRPHALRRGALRR